MKTIQLEANKMGNNSLLKAAGIICIHPGWYTVTYHGACCDKSTVTSAERNPGGEIRYVLPSRR